MIPLLVGFLVLDLSAIVILGPISPADTVADVARLYGDHGGRVLVSRFVQCLGLAVGLGMFGVLRGRMRELEGGPGTLSAIAFGGFLAVIPIELVRNVMFATLALRFDDIGAEAALPLHLIAVVIGPVIAFPLAAALLAIARLRRSPVLGAYTAVLVLTGLRIVTTSTVVWYVGFAGFLGLIVILVYLSLTFMPSRT